MFGVTGVTAHPQKAVLQPTTLEVILKLPPHIDRQLSPLLCHQGFEGGIILIHELIQEGAFRSMASIQRPISHTGFPASG